MKNEEGKRINDNLQNKVKSSSIFHFSLLIFNFILILTLTSCLDKKSEAAYREAVDLWKGGDTILYALSKEAKDGVLPLNTAGKLEYQFNAPITVPDNHSLEVGYQWNGTVTDGQAAIQLDEVLWELPKDFAFLQSIAPLQYADSFTIRYAIPLAEKTVSQITLHWTREDGEKVENTGSTIIIKSLDLVPTWFGFANDEQSRTLCLSPFVNSGDGVFYINPDEPYYNPRSSLLIKPNSRARFIIETGNAQSSYYYKIETEADAGTQFSIPGEFLYTASLPLRISVLGNEGPAFSGIIYSASSADSYDSSGNLLLQPISADPGLILQWPRQEWRKADYELFRWDSFPSILIFDFADYDVQDRFLKRLAFFAEKAGYVGRLAPDREIAGLHGWNAHDYKAETLAAFFDLAAKTNFPLLSEEKELEAILLNANIIRSSGGTIVPGEGAVISITRESPDYLRYLFMAHEGFHGIFFIDADFREFTKQRWDALAPVPKAFILSYFGYQAYDTTDSYLVLNEFMAHILQQSVSQAAAYFGDTLANRIDASSWRRTVLPPKDEATGTWPLLANAFTIEAQAFSRYVNMRWGLAAGRVSKVSVSGTN